MHWLTPAGNPLLKFDHAYDLRAVADVSLEERSTLVYNFEVAQDHNYFVGDEGAEAHNTPGWFWKNALNNTNTPNSIKGRIQTELARTKGD
ncbi:hypothetical protein FM996_15260 [Methylosinus sporium]|uniref:Uncharacterized protein n=1 Tax=Methylosinus sporium TaxID=428 RepID=A0A549SMF7_METSR|nr:hypothetical protein [Methylosinus sporium]TRL30819.1 hypothetical protein FM996_15260 [Methylosinus sporium]